METNNANVEKSSVLSDWLTVEEVGTYLRISRTTAYKMINDCTIPSVRLERVLRISKHELNDVLLKERGDKTTTGRRGKAAQEKNSTDSYCNDILSLKRAWGVYRSKPAIPRRTSSFHILEVRQAAKENRYAHDSHIQLQRRCRQDDDRR